MRAAIERLTWVAPDLAARDLVALASSPAVVAASAPPHCTSRLRAISFEGGLLPGGFIHFAGHFHAAQSVHILRDAVIERFRDALPVLAGFQTMLVGRIGDERNLGQDRRHVGA